MTTKPNHINTINFHQKLSCCGEVLVDLFQSIGMDSEAHQTLAFVNKAKQVVMELQNELRHQEVDQRRCAVQLEHFGSLLTEVESKYQEAHIKSWEQ